MPTRPQPAARFGRAVTITLLVAAVSAGAREARAQATAPGAPATPGRPADSIPRLPAEVVTATREPAAARPATSAATVLDATALRAAGVTHLADALRLVPGLAVAASSSFGSPTSLFVRGGQSNYVRVLVDGVPLNEPGGALDLGRVTLDGVERIEVVRGPASVLYGSDAVTGVVQLFTAGADRGIIAGEVGGASFGGRRASLATGNAMAGARWSFRADHHATDGVLAYNNGYRNDGLAASVSTGGPGQATVRLHARYQASSYRYPTGSAGALEDRNAERAEHRSLVGLDVQRQWTDRIGTRLSLAHALLHPRTSDGPDGPGDTLGFFGYTARGTVSRAQADLRSSVGLGVAGRLDAGVEFARDAETSASLSASEFGEQRDRFSAERRTAATYTQWMGDRGPLAWSVGARLDDNSAFGTFRTARAGLSWRLGPSARLRASVGNAFKAPSFYENFATGFVVGNASLRPERSASRELGLEAVLGRRATARATARVTAFRQHFRDLIQYTFTTPAPGDPNYYNIAAADASGIEAEVALPSVAGTAVAVSVTWLRTRVTDAGFDVGAGATFVDGQRLLRRPDRSGAVQLARSVGLGRVTATVTHTGARDDRDFSGFPAAPVRLAPVTLLDLSWGVDLPERVLPATRLLLRADNAFGTEYQQVHGFASPGRVLSAGLTFER